MDLIIPSLPPQIYINSARIALMGLPSEKWALFGLLLLLSSQCVEADFSLHSLNVFINVNRDGSANVQETLDILVDNSQSRELYEATRFAYSDIGTWGERTKLSDMRHHITRANADISSLRILPQPIERCNSIVGICHGVVVIDYLVAAGENGSGLMSLDPYKPRTLKYSLLPDALSFEQTKTGDLVLPKDTVITFSVPASAEKIYFSTLPSNVAEEPESAFRYDQVANLKYYVGEKRAFSWKGDTLPKFSFTYEIESPLEAEVLDFFTLWQSGVLSIISGSQGLAVFFLISAAASSAYYFHRMRG
jgi:hypothetical protein